MKLVLLLFIFSMNILAIEKSCTKFLKDQNNKVIAQYSSSAPSQAKACKEAHEKCVEAKKTEKMRTKNLRAYCSFEK